MECEICGSEIKGNAIRREVEGTVLAVLRKNVLIMGSRRIMWTPGSRKMTPTERVSYTRPKRDVFWPGSRMKFSGLCAGDQASEGIPGMTDWRTGIQDDGKATLIRKIEREELIPEDTVRKKTWKYIKYKTDRESIFPRTRSGGGFIRGTTTRMLQLFGRKVK